RCRDATAIAAPALGADGWPLLPCRRYLAARRCDQLQRSWRHRRGRTRVVGHAGGAVCRSHADGSRVADPAQVGPRMRGHATPVLAAVALCVAVGTTVVAQRSGFGPRRGYADNQPYDGRFVFVRMSY